MSRDTHVHGQPGMDPHTALEMEMHPVRPSIRSCAHTCVSAQGTAPRHPQRAAPADAHQSMFHTGSWAPTHPLPGHWTLDHAGGFLLVAAGQGDKDCGHGSTGKGQDELAHCDPSSVCPTPQQEQQLLPQEPSVALQG